MLKSFFWMCSGADTDLLANSPKSEQIKYAGIGGTVFFTALMAWIAGAYALFTVFDSALLAAFFGLIWGLLIFNLDRFIVSTIKKQDNKWSELGQAAPRIVLAIIIAVVISKPLEMKIFEKEIDRVILTQKNQMTLDNKGEIAMQYQPEIDRLSNEINAISLALADKEAEVEQLYGTYISEAEGTDGTMKEGKGPVYKEKREKHDASLAELAILRENAALAIADKTTQLEAVRADQKTQVSSTQPIIDRFDGFIARLAALQELPMLPQLFIFLLFVAVETSPVIAKLLAPAGAYDLRIDEEQNKLAVRVAQLKRQRAEMLKADTVLNEQAYESVVEERESYLYRKQRAREILDLQSDAFLKEQKGLLT